MIESHDHGSAVHMKLRYTIFSGFKDCRKGALERNLVLSVAYMRYSCEEQGILRPKRGKQPEQAKPAQEYKVGKQPPHLQVTACFFNDFPVNNARV